jgi:hypothetical protein
MTTDSSMTNTESISTKLQSREIPKGTLGIMLFGIVILSMNGGLFLALGLRHRSSSPDSLLFLIVGCFSVVVAVFMSVLIFSRARWVPSKRD